MKIYITIIAICLLVGRVLGQPIVNLGQDVQQCGGPVQLDAGNVGAAYLWSTGATTQQIAVSSSGSYWVAVTDGSGTGRDTVVVNLSFLSDLVLHDTTICAGTRRLTPIQNMQTGVLYRWYDAPSAGTLLNTGASYTASFLSPRSFFIEGLLARDTALAGYLVRPTSSPSGFYSIPDTRGLVFDVLQPMLMMSVEVPVQAGSLSATLEIRTAANVLLYSKPVSLVVGTNVVPLNVELPVGTGYRILLSGITGSGQLHIGAGTQVVYPNTANGLRVTSGFLSGAANTSFYCFFYNFRLSTNLCRSVRGQMNMAVNAAPEVNLPSDTSSCFGVVGLDATWSGASYLWSTGATTATLNITSNAMVGVTVTANGCATVDSSRVLVSPAVVFTRPDTTICAGPQTLYLQGSALNSYYWYNAATGGTLLNSGMGYTSNFANSATYYIEGQRALDTVLAGYSTQPTTSPSGYYSIPDTRGLVFDILQPLMLLSVEVPVQAGALSGTLEIRNSANTVLFSRAVSLVAGTNTVSLNYSLPTGTGYRIVLTGLSGAGTLHVGAGAQVVYPNTANGLRLTSGFLSGSPNTSFHFFFYNFRLSQNVCMSARQAFNLTVNPAPVVNLPVDTSSCTGALTLDASYSGATYVWNTGATAATQTFTSNSTAAVTVTANGCSTIDSSRVLVAPPISFLRADTTICSGVQTLTVQGSPLNSYLWYDAAAGGNLLNVGAAYTRNFASSATYYIEGQRVLDTVLAGYSAQPTTSPSGFYSIPDTRGLVFDILQPLQLMSVEIPVQGGALSATLEIRTSANVLLYSRAVSLVVGTNTVSINYNMPVGTGYRILLTGISGSGTLHVGAGAQVLYPNSANGLRLTSGFLSGSPNASFHFFFYNFRLSQHICVSARDEFILTVNPSPVLNLPRDTVVCGQTNFVLDAANTGAQYQWSTGATTQQINLTASGEVAVTVALAGCFGVDTAAVSLLDTVMFSVSDTVFCAGQHTLAVNGDPASTYIWWDAPSGGNIRGVGAQLPSNYMVSDTLYVQGQTPLQTYHEGLPNNTLINGIGSAYYTITTNNGLAFTASGNFLLKSVQMYADGLVQGTVELQTSGGAVLASRSISLVSGANRVVLNLPVPSAGNYRLVLRSPTGGGRIYVDAPNSGTLIYPLVYDNIRITSAVINNATVTTGNNSQIYSFFYDWEIVRLACPTARYPIEITVLPTPVVLLPADTVFCGMSASLDAHNAGNAGATYQWSDAQTTSAINISTSGTWTVTATIGQCSDVQTINISLTNPPTILVAPNDTTICGGQVTLHSSGNGFTQAWYASASATSPIALADSITVYVNSNTTLWLEAVGFVPKLATYGLAQPMTSFPTNYVSQYTMMEARGLEFDVLQPIRLDAVSMFVDSAAAQAKLSLYDANGFELQSMWVTLPNLGENIINLNWVLVPNNGYRLQLDSLSGGKIYAEQSGFPFVYNELRIQRGLPSALRTVYSFFYKWKISTLSCATPRDSVVITVPPYPILILPADTASCDAPSPISLTATANNPSYTYRWSNGQTTNTINTSTSGYYSVTVSNNGLCQTVQNTLVQFLQTPAPLLLPDTTICASAWVGLLQPQPNQIYQWFDYITPAQQIYLGAPYYDYVADTTPYLVGNAAKAVTRLGLQNNNSPNNPSLYQGYNIPNTFDLNQWAVLDSVAVYPFDAPATFDLVVRDASDQIIYTQTFTTHQAKTKIFLPINLALPPAAAYSLGFSNYNTQFLVDPAANYPLTTSAQVATLTGTTLGNARYHCFFDWHFSYASACALPDKDTFLAIPRLPLRLPQDSMFVCDTFLADASAPAAAAYLWSTGATSAAITVRNEGLYTVTISDGQGCIGIDSLLLQKPMPIGFSNANLNCGDVLYHNYSSSPAVAFLWNTGDTTANLFLQNGPATYSLTVTTLEGCQIADTANITTIEALPVFDLGNPRNLCIGDSLRVTMPNNNYIFQWSTGSTTNSARITNSNNYRLTVTSPNGCSATDQVVINAQPGATAGFNVFYQQGLDIGLNNTSQNYNLYHYNFGDSTPITTASFHRYDSAGCYIVSVIAQNGCGADTASIQVAIDGADCDTTISVTRLAAQNNFVLLPNPNHGQFELRFSHTSDQSTGLHLYNAQGQRLFTQILPPNTTNAQIDVQNLYLPAGAYLLHWQNPKSPQTQQFIILRD